MCRRIDGVEPRLACHLCRRAVAVEQGWLAFVPPSVETPQTATLLVHQRCLDGQAEHLFGSQHVTLWRLSDALGRALALE